MASGLKIEVNGSEHEVTASPDTPLLYVLHDELGLRGPRSGCGLGQCGACSVLLDGEEVQSCITPVAQANGRTVTTLEGLPALWAGQRDGDMVGGQLHPLQQAWIDEQVPQCGYCVGGMMIKAAELLTSTPNPSEEQIRAAMDGHLCRCGTYPRILAAIEKAAAVLADDGDRAAAARDGHEVARQAFEERVPERPHASHGPPDAGQIDSWIQVHADNTASILTGHQELGQGSATGLLMIAAEELGMDVGQLRFVTEDTAVTPNSFPTHTSQGITGNGPQVRAAAAAAKQVLLELAAEKLGVPTEQLKVSAGVVTGGSESVTYGELLGGRPFNTTIPESYNLDQSKMPGWSGTAGLLAGVPGTKSSGEYKVVGKKVPRIDIPPKVTGAYEYVYDVRLPGMLHGRVVLPPGQRAYGAGAPVLAVDERSIEHIPGARVVRRRDFVGVVAATEWDAVRAAEGLRVTWAEPPPLAGHENVFAHMRRLDADGQAKVSRTVDTGDVNAALSSAAHVVEREFAYPYQAHVPIGMACAVADVTPDGALVYSNSQDLWELQARLIAVLGLPQDAVQVHWVEGAGSFGGSPCRYDAPIAAAIMSQIVGSPVRVQFLRRDEHGWDNYGMPQLVSVRAGADSRGTITALDLAVTQLAFPIETYTIEELVGQPYADAQTWDPSTDVTGSQYTIPNWRLESRTLPVRNNGLLKTHYLRSPMAIGASFAVEQAIDELAHMVQMDPLEFRRRNVQTEDSHPQANFLWLGMYDYSSLISNRDRWLAVLDAVADAAGWKPRVAASALSEDKIVRGRGIALGGCGAGAYSVTYAAAVAEIEVNRRTGKIRVEEVYTCQDYGLVINPDLVENQAQGMTIQAVSRVLMEEVQFDEVAVRSLDWDSYPILRFKDAPNITHTTISRPEITPGPASEELMPSVTAAIANAFFDATGVRITRAPLKPERVLGALEAARAR